MRRTLLSRGWLVFLAGCAVMTGAAAAYTTPRLKPPPPPPTYLSSADHDRLEAVLDAIDHRDWRRARREAASVADPIARSLADWFYFNAEDPSVDIAEADAFLDSNPDWPSISKIQSHVERRMPNTASPDLVLAFFDTREPITGEGKLQMTQALFEKDEDEAAVIHLRDAWINHTFTLSDEKRLLARYGRRLHESDHAARVDRLLWSRQVTNARRVFSRLSSHNRRMAEARAALLLGASSGPKLFNSLPAEERLDSGILLAAVRYYRRTNDEELAISLARQAPSTSQALRNPSRWWEERQLLMRWALKNGRFADAYAMAAGHGLEPESDYAEAEFDAGWIALRFLNEPERAELHFKALAAAVASPISTARAYYWLGRTAEARGATELALARYNRSAEHIYTYHGQLAAEKLGGTPLEIKFAPPTTSTPADRARFSSRPVVAALRMLSDLDRDHEFLVFAYNADDQLESPGEYVELAKLAERKGAPHITVRAGKVGIGRGAFAPEVAYPLIFVPDEAKRFTPPEIVLGLSRQESEFNPRAYSRAGARGLMQLLPTTAQLTARKAGLPYSRAALLDDPTYNMTIGAAHIADLLERFNGSLVLTLAAYNAGALRADRWVEDYGDPRAPDVDPLDWVELIPFSETRNYVQRVLENMQVYRSRLGDQPIAGRLAADLERGGPRGRAGAGTQISPVLLVAASGAGPQMLPPLPPRVENLAEEEARQDAQTIPAPESSPAPPQSAPEGMEPEAATEKTPPDLDDGAALRTKTIDDARAGAVESNTVMLQRGAQKPSGIPVPANHIAAPRVDKPSAPDEAAVPALSALTGGSDEFALTSGEPCLTYRDFLIEVSEDEPSAADLNAGSLAEMRGGGAACD